FPEVQTHQGGAFPKCYNRLRERQITGEYYVTLGELEALQEKELRLRTSVALQQYYEMRGIDSHAYLIEAQFYMRELEQRDSKRIAHRDYRMELGIMALIVVEIIIAIFSIWIGFREAKEQAEATHSQ